MIKHITFTAYDVKNPSAMADRHRWEKIFKTLRLECGSEINDVPTPQQFDIWLMERYNIKLFHITNSDETIYGLEIPEESLTMLLLRFPVERMPFVAGG